MDASRGPAQPPSVGAHLSHSGGSPTTPMAPHQTSSVIRRTASTGNLVGLRRRIVASLPEPGDAQPGLAAAGRQHTPNGGGLARAASLGAGLNDLIARDAADRREPSVHVFSHSQRDPSATFHGRSQSLASLGDAHSVSSSRVGQLGVNFELPEHRTLGAGRSTRPIFNNAWSHEGRFLKQIFSGGAGAAGGSNVSSLRTSPSNISLSPRGTSPTAHAGSSRRFPDAASAGASATTAPTAGGSSQLTAAALARHRQAHHLHTLFATEEVLPHLYASDVQLPRLFATSEHGPHTHSVSRLSHRRTTTKSESLRDGKHPLSAGASRHVSSVRSSNRRDVHDSDSDSSSSSSSRSRSSRSGDGGEGSRGPYEVENDFLHVPANFSGYRSRNLNALDTYTWDRRLFLPTNRWCLTRVFSLFASPRFWEKIDWTVRGSIFTILPTMVLCLEPTTEHIFPLPTSVVSYAYWFSQPTFGAGLRELYVVIKGFSVSLVVFCIFLAIHPGPVVVSLVLMFVFVLLISFFAEQTKRTSAWCICSLTMQYTRTPSTTTFKFLGDYYVTLLIGIAFGLAAFIVPYIRWSSVNAEHYLAVVADSVSLSSRGMCGCLWTSTPLIRQLHLARLRQLRATTEKSFAKMKTALSEMGYEPHRGTYSAQLKTRSAFFTQMFYLQRSVIQMLEDVGHHPLRLDTPLCRAFGERLVGALARYGAALDAVLVSIGRVDELISKDALDSFRDELKAFEDAISVTREVVVLNNPDYQTDESDLLIGFYLFHLTEMGRITAEFKESENPPNNLLYLLRLPERDIMSVVAACRALAISVWRRHTITRRLKESIKLSLCLFIAGIFQVYAMDNEGTSPIGGVDIIAWVYRDTGGESFTYATYRLLGTVLGSLTGLLGVQIAAGRREVLYILSTILCFIGTYIMASPGWAALGSAMVMSVVSMAVQFRNSNAAMVRIQQNCFAILIYFILSSFIWPVKARSKMKMGLDLSIRSFREVVWRLFRNLHLPESEANVASDASLLLTEMQKRISVQESNLAGATGEPTFDSAEFPAVEWRALILDQRHLMLSLLSMRFAYHAFMSSKMDGALSVHWRVLHGMSAAAGEFSELVYAACDVYLMAVCRATLLPTAHLTCIREGLSGCYQDMLRAYVTTIGCVMRGDYEDLRLRDDDKNNTEGGGDGDKALTCDAPPPHRASSTLSAHTPAGTATEDGASPALNDSFARFNLTTEEVSVLRHLLRLSNYDPPSTEAGTRTSPHGALTSPASPTPTAVPHAGQSAQPSSKLNSTLVTANNTFAGPSPSGTAGAGDGLDLNSSFFPGAFTLDHHGPSATPSLDPRRSLQRVQEVLSRRGQTGAGGQDATPRASSSPPGASSAASVEPQVAPLDGVPAVFTLNSSIVLPRGSYVPSTPPPPDRHPQSRPHPPSPSSEERVSVLSNGEYVSPAATAAAHTHADFDPRAPGKRRSRLLSRLLPGASYHSSGKTHSDAAAAAKAVSGGRGEPTGRPAAAVGEEAGDNHNQHSPTSPPAPRTATDAASEQDRDVLTTTFTSVSSRANSPPPPHNYTFVGPSGAGHLLNASFIPRLTCGGGGGSTLVDTQAADDAAKTRRATTAGVLPSSREHTTPTLVATAASVDLFSLPRRREGLSATATTPTAAALTTTTTTTQARRAASILEPERLSSPHDDTGDDVVNAASTAAAAAATDGALTLPHTPEQVPRTLLTPLVPTTQFHAEMNTDPHISPPRLAASIATTTTHTNTAAAAMGGGGGGLPGAQDDDALPPVVLSNRDIHSLEAFLYGIDALMKQLDNFEQHLLETVHANEMAKKL